MTPAERLAARRAAATTLVRAHIAEEDHDEVFWQVVLSKTDAEIPPELWLVIRHHQQEVWVGPERAAQLRSWCSGQLGWGDGPMHAPEALLFTVEEIKTVEDVIGHLEKLSGDPDVRLLMEAASEVIRREAMAAPDLDALLDALQSKLALADKLGDFDDPRRCLDELAASCSAWLSEIPTFGGSFPAPARVVSWDADRSLVSRGYLHWEIRTRNSL